MDVPETTHAAANMAASHRPGEQHAAHAAQDNQGEYTSSRDDSTATGDKRKRGEEAGEPGDGVKRVMFALPFRGRPAIAPPSHQEQQILIGSEVQTSNAEPSEAPGSNPPPSENQSMSDMQLDATEGQKFRDTLFSAVSMMRMLRQRSELYDDALGKYRRRCNVVESFQTSLEELEKKKQSATVTPKLLSEIVEYRNQLSKFTPGLDALKEEKNRLLEDYDALHDEVDAAVEGVLAYDESLKDDEVIWYFPASFWEVFKGRQEAGIAAAQSATAQRKAIEDERAAIRGRMEGRFKQKLINRLTNTSANDAINVMASTEEDVRKLSELLVQQEGLQGKEKLEVQVLRLQSGKLLKIAEETFKGAGLL